MHRFYHPDAQSGCAALTLSGSEAHHAVRVLRLNTGDRVELINGRGARFICRVIGASRKELQLHVLDFKQEAPPGLRIELLLGLPKTKALEWVFQKCTELGVSRIAPVICEHSEFRPAKRTPADKIGKWRQITIEAAKQSGSLWLPDIAQPASVIEHSQNAGQIDTAIVATLDASARSLRDVLREAASGESATSHNVAVWIGPEGGFSETEVEIIRGAGAVPVHLGKRTLRSETAVVFCVSAVNYEFDE
ncbi:MAG: 16S rRNA (uracil(1498)-N(3))-methyltransferase [Verrucomicrobia bacterium]|nr:16S rRNA (uracil(1498)-N(3))-methyltransferase [Verrucomicrobiota bacterium]